MEQYQKQAFITILVTQIPFTFGSTIVLHFLVILWIQKKCMLIFSWVRRLFTINPKLGDTVGQWWTLLAVKWTLFSAKWSIFTYLLTYSYLIISSLFIKFKKAELFVIYILLWYILSHDFLESVNFKLLYNSLTLVAIDTSAAEDETYSGHLQELSLELEESSPRQGKIASLMKKTFRGRRRWIIEERPTVAEVLEKFPCLKRSSRVRP